MRRAWQSWRHLRATRSDPILGPMARQLLREGRPFMVRTALRRRAAERRLRAAGLL